MNRPNGQSPFRISAQLSYTRHQLWRQWLERVAEKVVSLERLGAIYGRLPSGLTTDQFLAHVIEELRLDYRIELGGVSNIPLQDV